MLFGIIIWLVVGGIIGWLASVIMHSATQQNILINIIMGVIGSYIGGALFAPLIRVGAPGSYLCAIAGAALLLGIVSLFRRGSMR